MPLDRYSATSMPTGVFRFSQPVPITDWKMTVVAADSCISPEQAFASGDVCDALVPETAAQSLHRAGRWIPSSPAPLHDKDIWYRCEVDGKRGARIRFDGLATLADIFVDGEERAASSNMFTPLEVVVQRDGPQEVAIAFRSLERHLAQVKGRRARWKTLLIDKPNLRFVRTTLLGHMPGWCPAVDIVGPYRPVVLLPPDALTPRDVHLRPAYDGKDGKIVASIESSRLPAIPEPLYLQCRDRRAEFRLVENQFVADLDLPDIEPWMPCTHGVPALHDVSILQGDASLALGKTGFRKIEVDRGADGSRFQFVVNGQKIFARGACWTHGDLSASRLDADFYRRELSLMRDAGFNLVRIAGIAHYEAPEFYKAADEFGIMVWQDLPFANFDYPFEDPDFQSQVRAELGAFLTLTSASPSLVAVCGDSEVMQQAAMMGLPRKVWDVCTNASSFAQALEGNRPDVAFVENSPSCGALPFHVDSGVGHYYGVGAYLRPLDDARRANVTFAAECLAFSNIPNDSALAAAYDGATINHPHWKSGIPRDRGADWDFENVREHYMKLLYDVDCMQLRRSDPAGYLAYARATTAEVMETTFAEWRRPQSSTGGALVFSWKDPKPGAGWGLVDSTGQPKSVWHALRRACRPLNLTMTDEGVNGLHLHIVNETQHARHVVVELSCLAQGEHEVGGGAHMMCVEAGSGVTLNAVDLLGAFFDVNYAYRFGRPAHNVVVASLRHAETKEVLAQAFYFPLGRAAAMHAPELAAEIVVTTDGPALSLSCKRVAQTVNIDVAGAFPADNYFHLAPNSPRLIRLSPQDGATALCGAVSSLNDRISVQF